MKKKLLKMAALAMVLMLAGCGKAEEQGEPSLSESSAAESSTPLHQMKMEDYVTLGDYSNLAVSVNAVKVDDAEVLYLMQNVYLSGVNAENGGITDRAVENGDTVIIDYCGKKDGVAFQGGTAEGASLGIGTGTFIEGFEEGLIGVMPGETVDLDLTFPEQYHSEELAGQAVVFTVTVHCILPKEVAEEDMTDEVISALGLPNVTNVSECRTFVKDYLMQNAQTEYDAEVEGQILEGLLNGCTFAELPEAMLQSYIKRIGDNIAYSASMNQVTPDVYANYYYNMTSEQAANQYGERALMQDLALQAIANKEGLTISDEELDTQLQTYATQGGYESVEAFLGTNSREDYRNYYMSLKVMDFLKENAKIEEK